MEEEFKTGDLWLTSFLLVKGAELVQLEKDPERPYHSVFALVGEDLKEKAQGFSKNEDVPVLTFKQVLLDVKHKLYRRNQNNETRGKTNEGTSTTSQ